MRAVEFNATVKDHFINIPLSISELKDGQKIKVIAMIETPIEDELKYHLDSIMTGVFEAENKKGKKLRAID